MTDSHRALAPAAPVIARLLVGIVMTAHGWQKRTEMTPAGFSGDMLSMLGVPAPVFFGVDRHHHRARRRTAADPRRSDPHRRPAERRRPRRCLAAGEARHRPAGPMGSDMPGAELEFGLLAGLLVVALLGPGELSLDHVIRIEDETPTRSDASHRVAARRTPRAGPDGQSSDSRATAASS